MIFWENYKVIRYVILINKKTLRNKLFFKTDDFVFWPEDEKIDDQTWKTSMERKL